jgi:hypothetical protein
MRRRQRLALLPEDRRTRRLGIALKYVPVLRYVLLRRAFLKSSGFVKSAWANAPVDADGRPLAWYTYAALGFLEGRVRPDLDVFEYGAGNSTLWWGRRARSVTAVESSRAWADHLRPVLPANAELIVAEADEAAYAAAPRSTGRRYDIVVIDGIARNACAAEAVHALTDEGVVLWDNTERGELYREGFDVLEAAGFRRLDFGGIGPLNGYGTITTVFYRPANCLGI